jgi:uncharacterized protein YraI
MRIRFIGWAASPGKIFAIFLAPALAMALLSAPAHAQPADQATVTTGLNQREGPGTNFAVIQILPGGATVAVHECQAGWCRVTFQGRTGWASESYLAFGGASGPPPAASGPPPGDGQVQASTTVALHMRTGPSTTYGAILTIPAGATVTVTRCTDNYDWCEVRYGGSTGWVYAAYIQSQERQQPVADVGAQLGLRLFEFILGQIGQEIGRPGNGEERAEVCFFADFNFGGESFCVQPDATEAQIREGWNDRISSIRITGGAELQVCEHFNFEGWCERYSQSIAQLPPNQNDEISSFRVR